MGHHTKMVALLGAIAMVAVGGAGCDGQSQSTGTAGSAGNPPVGGGGAGGDTGGAGGGTGGGTTTGTGGTGGTGGSTPGDGAQATDWVSCGGVSKSTSYTLVHTLGQSTQNQGKTTSTNYRMQGGLIGATGSSK